MPIKRALERVPDYQRFLTVDEMFARTREVAKRYPELARYEEIGISTDGEAIPLVTIGHGPKRMMLFACPHPNEPIGAMLVQFLLDELIENDRLREGFTWYLMPCVDPDGTRLNEGWFGGPYTIRNYAAHFYRPRSAEQVEWTFPVSYKAYSWQTPMPETRALMKAIELARPDFLYSLHNAGFGGVYYYISHDLKDAYADLESIPVDLGLWLSLGEPEMPWAVTFHPAIYKVSHLRDAYDYFEQYSDSNPVEMLTGGASSFEFAEAISQPISLVTELPYFQSPQVADTSKIDRTRRDVILDGIRHGREMFEVMQKLLADTKSEMAEDTRFLRAVASFADIIPKTLHSKERWAEEASEMEAKATVAQEADELHVGTFYRVLIASMLNRAFDHQLSIRHSVSVERAKEELAEHLDHWIDAIEASLDYEAIPIRTLVQAQYGALLAIMRVAF